MGLKRTSELTEASALSGLELVAMTQKSGTVFKTATTISALASDNSFNDSGNGLITAGFAEGDRVMVEGFTGNVVNNLVGGVILTLTAGKMIIQAPKGDVIVDDAAGESVTISKLVTVFAYAEDIAALGGGSGGLSVVATDADDYTVLAADVNKYIRLTGASTKNITVQDDATEALPDDGEWHFRNVGAGDASFVEGTGVTINPPAGGTLDVPQGGTVTLKRVAVDEFDLFGSTVAL